MKQGDVVQESRAVVGKPHNAAVNFNRCLSYFACVVVLCRIIVCA